MKETDRDITLGALTETIYRIHNEFAARVNRAVNMSLTLRNWLIGCYITEYELNGSDRAAYGERVVEVLASTLQSSLDRCYTTRYLRLCRQFYTSYPHLRKSLISETNVYQQKGKSLISLLPSLSEHKIETALSPVKPELIIKHLSFTHIIELMKCENPTKRAFYEIECIRGNWSVRELKRQVSSLFFERSGLSIDKEKLSELANRSAEQTDLRLTIRDPYVFEFLGLKPQEVMNESHLEDELIRRLEDFLLELGHGFCFEARQKRIQIGGEDFFIDLVFYHRLLKCHVLVELKIDKFRHENLGQLNTYVNWFTKNMMADGDNPPVGILLCTDKNRALAEYALAGMDNQLFISRYQLQLPGKEEMESFIEEQVLRAGHKLSTNGNNK